MNARTRFAIAIAAIVSLATASAHAGPQTATYVTASAGVGFVTSACTDTDPPLPPVPRICPAGNIGYGGFVFPGTSTAPISVKIVDASGERAQGITVCQDANGDELCGAPDPVARFCATGATQSLSGFKANVDTAVFVYAVHTSCEGIGTTGTITLTN